MLPPPAVCRRRAASGRAQRDGQVIRQVQRGRVVLLAVTLLVVLWLSLGSAAAQQQPSAAPGQREPDATAALLDRTGRTVASVEFRQVDRDVLVRLTPADPPRLTGAHALEIHAVAACQPFDFASAGALFKPLATASGGGGPALGRLPNINYTTGLSAYQASLHGASLLRGVPNSLIGGQGTAVVMFDKPNDGASPPAGNPSDRIACGPIRPTQGTATGQSALPNQVAQPVTLAQAVPAAGQPTATPTPARLTPSATPIRAAPAVVVQPSAPGTALGASTLKEPDANATLRDRSGRTLATVELRQVNRDVRLSLTFADPPRLTGTHGIQIHAVDACDLPDFASAGPLFNPTNKAHGSSSPGGPALGDLPNINYTTGLSTYQANIRGASLLRGVPNSLIGGFGTASRGTSVVLFDKADDGKTQPEGNAGDRIACGVIRPAQAAVATVAGTATPTRSALTPTATPTRPATTPTATPTRAVAGAVAGQPTATPTRPVAGAVAGQPTATPTRSVAGAVAGQPTATPTRPGRRRGGPTDGYADPASGRRRGWPTDGHANQASGRRHGGPTDGHANAASGRRRGWPTDSHANQARRRRRGWPTHGHANQASGRRHSWPADRDADPLRDGVHGHAHSCSTYAVCDGHASRRDQCATQCRSTGHRSGRRDPNADAHTRGQPGRPSHCAAASHRRGGQHSSVHRSVRRTQPARGHPRRDTSRGQCCPRRAKRRRGRSAKQRADSDRRPSGKRGGGWCAEQRSDSDRRPSGKRGSGWCAKQRADSDRRPAGKRGGGWCAEQRADSDRRAAGSRGDGGTWRDGGAIHQPRPARWRVGAVADRARLCGAATQALGLT